MDIVHDAPRQCFEAWVDGQRCELDYRREPGRLIITHTGTAPALRGRGLAARLVEHALQWAAPLELQLLPACSYVQLYLQRQPRWQRLQECTEVQQVLNFWFGALGGASDDQLRAVWFKKDTAFDDEVCQRFGALLEQALAGGLRAWESSPFGTLARVLVLDQFTRNAYRGQARAFAGDAQALGSALALIDRGQHGVLTPLQRWFIYLPLEHAEDLALQQRCVRLFEALATEDARLAGALDYAHRHLAVIEKFGRFPHRNAILGRCSSTEELDYLAQPGSGF